MKTIGYYQQAIADCSIHCIYLLSFFFYTYYESLAITLVASDQQKKSEERMHLFV